MLATRTHSAPAFSQRAQVGLISSHLRWVDLHLWQPVLTRVADGDIPRKMEAELGLSENGKLRLDYINAEEASGAELLNV